MYRKHSHARGLSVWQATIKALIFLLLASCSTQVGPASSGNTNQEGKNPANIHVGFVSETASLNFALEMADGAQYAANQYHVSAQIVAPFTFNDPEALGLFNNLIQTARDGIAVETLAPD